jgi:uncharacterized membrane protein
VITDFVRRKPLWVLGMLFAVIVVVVGRWKGFWSLLALLLSFSILLNKLTSVATVLAAVVVGKNWVPEKELARGETHAH